MARIVVPLSYQRVRHIFPSSISIYYYKKQKTLEISSVSDLFCGARDRQASINKMELRVTYT